MIVIVNLPTTESNAGRCHFIKYPVASVEPLFVETNGDVATPILKNRRRIQRGIPLHPAGGRDGRRTLERSRSTINRETAAIISRQFN